MKNIQTKSNLLKIKIKFCIKYAKQIQNFKYVYRIKIF